jgi:hypothetical protein
MKRALLIALLLGNSTTTNMGLVVDTGWPPDLQTDMTIIDAHTHSSGQGVLVTPAGMDISALLPFNGFAPTGMGYAGFDDGGPGPSVPLTLWTNGIDLCYEDGNGNKICLTSGGQVNVPALDAGLYLNGNVTVDGGVTLVKAGSCFVTPYGVTYCDNAEGDGVITPASGENLRVANGAGLVLFGDGGIFQSGANMLIEPQDGGYPTFNSGGGALDSIVVKYGGIPLLTQSPTGTTYFGATAGPGDAGLQVIPDTTGSGIVTIQPFGVTDNVVNIHLGASGAAQVVTTSPLVADAGLLIGPWEGAATAIKSHHWGLLFMDVHGLAPGTTTQYSWGPPSACSAPWPTPPCICGSSSPYGNNTCPDGGTLGSMTGVLPSDSCNASVMSVFNDGGIQGGVELYSPLAMYPYIATGLPNQGPVNLLLVNETGTTTDGGAYALVSIACDSH